MPPAEQQPLNEPVPRTFIFTHIPKNAGSTLKHILERQCSAKRHLLIEGKRMPEELRAFAGLDPSVRHEIDCLWGHVPYGIHRWWNVYYRSVNVTPMQNKTQPLSERARDFILSHNPRDVHPYEFATRHFDRRLLALGTGFHHRVARFQALNAWYGKLHSVYRASGIPRLKEVSRRA